MSINARFRLQQGDFTLAAEIDAPQHGVTAIFGPSGCGKSTLLRCVAGLTQPSGYCRIGDETWQDERRFLPPHRRALGMVFQDARLFAHLDVQGNLRYAAKRAKVLDQMDAIIDLLELRPLLKQTPATLSGGERQRVAIGRALLCRPRLLLLDEPLSALDAARKADILPYLERLVQELRLPALYVTHDIDEVVRLADRLILMDGGRTLAAGPTQELLSDLNLPLAHRDDAGTVLSGQVEAIDAARHLTIIKVGSQQLRIPRETPDIGAPVRIRVAARDVSLTLDPPQRTSILNILRAEVAGVGEPEQGQRVIRLRTEDDTVLLARISELSYEHLALQPGLPVYAQVKSAALV